MPDFPYGVKVRRMGITGRFMGATLSPKPIASISLPAYLLSFGSNVSIWLMPPHMNRKMTDFALGLKCGPMWAPWNLPVRRPHRAQRRAEESAAGLREEAPPVDSAARIDGASDSCDSPNVDELVEVVQQPGKTLEARRIVLI